MERKAKLTAYLEKLKLPLLVLFLGVFLMLLPSGAKDTELPDDPGDRMQEILSHTRGVGRAMVLISEKGVVIACTGADDPQVRLDIIRAIGSYTGFGSDRITVLKLADET
ncbi:MAG: hypothetical protein IJQ42_04340 [Oscillospiraceae bacterium]|nr:hypothetical protein [Oscillospiraceae bacterium]